MLVSRCERTCELLGDVKVSQLLGKPDDPDTGSRADPFATILASRKDDLPDGDGGTEVEKLIKQLNLAEEPIYYRDFFTKSKEEWGGSAADGIVAAMKAGEDLFIQPQYDFLNEKTTRPTHWQMHSILYGWDEETKVGTASVTKRAAGFVDLCGDETVVRALTVYHEGHKAERWIDLHLYPWLMQHNCLDARKFGPTEPTPHPNEGEKETKKCGFYVDAEDRYYCASHPTKDCKVVDGVPQQGTQYCDPPESR
jgi:hypothetical protein